MTFIHICIIVVELSCILESFTVRSSGKWLVYRATNLEQDVVKLFQHAECKTHVGFVGVLSIINKTAFGYHVNKLLIVIQK